MDRGLGVVILSTARYSNPAVPARLERTAVDAVGAREEKPTGAALARSYLKFQLIITRPAEPCQEAVLRARKTAPGWSSAHRGGHFSADGNADRVQ